MRRTTVLTSAVLALAMGPWVTSALGADRTVGSRGMAPSVSTAAELLVSMRPGHRDLPRVAGSTVSRVRRGARGDVVHLRFASAAAQAEAARTLRASAGVKSVSAVGTVSPAVVGAPMAGPAPKVPNYFGGGQQWGIYSKSGTVSHPHGVDAPAIWAAGGSGAGTVVAVVDEGVQTDHPDLLGQIWTNTADPVNGVDDDANGFADDNQGWDFSNGDRTVYDGGPTGSEDQHGTMVAGAIASKQERRQVGVVGMAPFAKILPIKMMDSGRGSSATAVAALEYVISMRQRGVNIVAVNASWGMGTDSPELRSAIVRLNELGVQLVAAAGNSASNLALAPLYPAAYDLPNVITVAAIDPSGAMPAYSNWGGSTDLTAPGSMIWSTGAGSQWRSDSGTSMAAPIVTGALAAYLSSGRSATGFNTCLKTGLAAAAPTLSLSACA